MARGDTDKPDADWDEYPINPRTEAKLISQAIRWNMKLTDEGAENALTDPESDLRSLALARTRKHILSEDDRVSLSGVRNLLAMERQNQEDEKPLRQVLHAHVAVKSEPDKWTALAEELGLDGFLEGVQSGSSEVDSGSAESSGTATEEAEG